MKYFLVFLISFSPIVFAGNANHSGKISKVRFFAISWGSYSETDDAVMVFYMEPSLPSACGTGDNRIAIGINHPLYSSVVSAVLAAKMSDTQVNLSYLTTCSKRPDAWDFGYIGIE